MANHNFLKKLKYGFVTFLAILFLFCAQAFCLTACGNQDATNETTTESSTETESTTSDPSYTFKEPEDGEIANAYFTKGTASKDLDDYPLGSPSDWTKSYDNSAVISYTDSGVIDVSSEGWAEISKKLKEKKTGETKDNSLIRALCYQIYGDETAEHLNDIKENFDTYFANPGLYSQEAKDSKLYMLNNYPSEKYIGAGTAQYIKSSSNITLEKGKTALITVWVNTINITGHGKPENRGANIVITNKINGLEQNAYKISSIDTKGEWKQYQIYVTADPNYPTSLNIKLGLGYGGGKSTAKTYYTQGTAFFDDLSYEIVDKPTNIDNAYITKLDLNEVASHFEQIAYNKTKTTYHYDMTLGAFASYNTLTANSFTGTRDNNSFFTTSNIEGQNGLISTETIFGANNSSVNQGTNKNEFTLTNASASIKLSSAEWKLTGKKFAFVSFSIKNELVELKGSTKISVDVYDKFGTKEQKQTDVVVLEETSEDFVTYTLLIQNNFSSTTDSREFYIVINVGPTDMNAIENITDVASGKVTISDVNFFIDDQPEEDEEDKNYQFIAGSVNKTIALYAGYGQDSTEDEETTDSYSFETKPSEIGAIVTGPAKVKDYFGVVADHSYVNSDSNIYTLDTRTGDGEDGSYAGLINTKYLDNYSLKNIPVGNYTDNIQPLMIYNNTPDNYGYVGKSFTIDSDSYEKVSLKVRVVGDAVAYIYLVDVSSANKNVLTFGSFTPNASDMVDNKGTIGSINTKLMLKIDSTILEKENKEWVNVEFYIATGASSKEVRIEVWNGSRDGLNKSQGYVFFNDITTESPSQFDGASWENAFENSSHPLFNVVTSLNQDDVKSLISYERPLTDIEKQFNEEYKSQKEYQDYIVEYHENYIWAETSTMIYAVYNTIDPVEIDPYTLLPEEEEEVTEEEGSGCAAKNDPSTFWLSFSSIVLGVVLVLAIIALILKNYNRRHSNGPDANKSHYNVSSRIKSQREINKKKAEERRKALEEEMNQVEPQEELTSQEDDAEENQTEIEQELDNYVYGEVIEDFTTQPDEQQVENVEETSNEQPKED